jgi:iron complex transport system substrate-binding protein
LIGALLICLILPASAFEVDVPGDLDGDDIVSDDELGQAESRYSDGKITSEEVETIRTIHDRYPRTFTDSAGREITLYKPPEKIITREPDTARIVVALGMGDKLIASEQAAKSCLCPTTFETFQEGCLSCFETILGGRMADLPETSTRYDIYYEQMAALQPDLIITSSSTAWEDFEVKVGCPCVVASGTGSRYTYDNGLYGMIQVMGQTLDREGEADALIAFVESKIDLVRSVTDGLDDSQKPTVYIAPRGAVQGFYDPKEGRDFTRTEASYQPLEIAGGLNVARGETGTSINVGVEQIIAWSPDYIFVACSSPEDRGGIDFVLTSPDLQSITAISENHVYNFFYPYCRGSPPDRSLFNMLYMAKVLHPDLFEDLDLEKEGNEIFKAFLGVDGVFTEYIDYLIWPREYLNNL